MVIIGKLKIKQGDENEYIECKPINLVLGANNTGKSSFLRDITNTISALRMEPSNKWIQGMILQIHKPKESIRFAIKDIDSEDDFHSLQQKYSRGGGSNIFGFNFDQTIYTHYKNSLPESIEYKIEPTHPHTELQSVVTALFRMAVQSEFCDSRLTGPFSAEIKEIDIDVENIVHYLYLHSDIFKNLSKHIFETFDVNLIFDDLQQGWKHIRLNPINVISENDRLNNESLAKFWRDNSSLLQEQGDGLKAYTKLSFGLFNEAKNIILIDEPEAFLHPPQRRSLGKFLGENILKGKQIFIATHDTEFLRGLLTSSVDKNDIQVIHLKNEVNGKSYNVLKFDEVYDKSSEYSESILGSFFHTRTVLTEAEDDRMIYQFAARKYFPDKSVNVQFIGLNGKSEVIKNYGILKKKQTSVFCIVDIDFLYSNDVLNNFINYTGTEKTTIKECKKMLETELSLGKKQRGKSKKEHFQKKGINYFSDETKRRQIQECI